MPCGERRRTEIARCVQEIAKLHALIAADTRKRRLACGIRRGEILHDRMAETLLVVENIMRNADEVGDTARVVNILTGAAGALALDRLAVIVELQRDAHDVVALLLQKRGRDGRIDAARHGDNHPRLLGASREIEAVQACRFVEGLTHDRLPPAGGLERGRIIGVLPGRASLADRDTLPRQNLPNRQKGTRTAGQSKKSNLLILNDF